MGKIVKAIVVFSIVVVGIAGVVVLVFFQKQSGLPVVNSVKQQVVNPVSNEIAEVQIPAEIVSVNTENSTIEIKYLKDPINHVYMNKTIVIPPEVKILKGEDSLELSELKPGDSIAITVSYDASGDKIKSISLGLPGVKQAK